METTIVYWVIRAEVAEHSSLRPYCLLVSISLHACRSLALAGLIGDPMRGVLVTSHWRRESHETYQAI